MSKVVSGVGNALGGVLKGAASVVKSIGEGVGKVVKSIASSDVGKAILIAGAIYFGGAAIAGGYSSAAGGGSFFTGMGAGVSSAASSLSSAWTSAMAGNFAEAGSTLGSSWSTAAQAGAATSPGYAAALSQPTVSLTEGANAPASVAPESVTAPVNSGAPVETAPLNGTDQIARAENNGKFLTDLSSNPSNAYTGNGLSAPGSGYTGGNGINGASYGNSLYQTGTNAGASVWDKVISSPYTAPALISGGMTIGGAYIQGQAQEKQLREQREYEERMAREARERYNANVGAQLWDPNQQTAIYQNQGPAWDPYAEARARAAQVYAPAQTGLAAKYMTPTTA